MKTKTMTYLVLFMVASTLLVIPAYAQSTSKLNQTISSLDGFLATPRAVPVFYLLFFIVALCFFMGVMLRMRGDQYAFVFGIAATIISIILGIVFTAPFDFVHVEKET